VENPDLIHYDLSLPHNRLLILICDPDPLGIRICNPFLIDGFITCGKEGVVSLYRSCIMPNLFLKAGIPTTLIFTSPDYFLKAAFRTL
jgi:hypothetical protein